MPPFRIPRCLFAAAIMTGGATSPGPVAGATESAWVALHSDDLPTYVAHLRAEGFPEDAIGLLVSHELNQRFANRERALQPGTLSVEGLRNFWSFERRAESRLLRLEKQMLARAVLTTAPGTTAETDWVAQHLPELSTANRDLVRAITEDYDDLIQRVRDASRGFLTTEDRDAIIYLEGERERDLSAILTADQLIDFDIQHTAAGRLLLDDLACFEPTPAEVRDYYAQMVAQGIDRIALELESPDASLRRIDARDQAVAALEKVWTTERFARLRFCLYQPYRKIYALVHRLGKTTAEADATLASLRQLMDAIRAIDERRPYPHDTPARRTEIIGLYERHRAAVRAILGEAGFDQYYELYPEVFSWLEQGQWHWLKIEL